MSIFDFIYNIENDIDLIDELKNTISVVNKKYKGVIVVCIGTDKCIADTFGPFVGSYLEDKCSQDFVTIVGTLQNPLHALNLSRLDAFDLDNNLVIAVDATVSTKSDVGTIKIRPKGIKPGSGLDKNLGCYGDIAVMLVTVNKDDNIYFPDNGLSLYEIMNTSEKIANAINTVIKDYCKPYKRKRKNKKSII